MESPEVDRISSLHDDILGRILSHLPTKHAVASTVLSTRWKNQWKTQLTSVPDLDFDDSLTHSQTTDIIPFFKFVCKVINTVLATATYIRKLHLRCKLGPYDSSVISLWVYLASTNNVEDLLVSVGSLENPLPFPVQLFQCQTLRNLQLMGKFPLWIRSDVLLPSLKTLELFNVVLEDDESVRRLFRGCIVLEKLYMVSCVVNKIHVLELSVASLKDLKLIDTHGNYKLSLEAPSLEFFHCDSYNSGYSRKGPLKSLLSASIDIGLGNKVIVMVSNARSLKLNFDSMNPFSKGVPTLPNLTKLWLYAHDARGWLSLPELLDSAPCLEALYFNDGCDDVYGNFMDVASCLPERVPPCVSTRLKRVKVGRFRGKEEEYKLVEYFLKNGKLLEEMTITPYHVHCPTLDRKYHFRIAKRLLNLPRSSRACQLFFTCPVY